MKEGPCLYMELNTGILRWASVPTASQYGEVHVTQLCKFLFLCTHNFLAHSNAAPVQESIYLLIVLLYYCTSIYDEGVQIRKLLIVEMYIYLPASFLYTRMFTLTTHTQTISR